MIDSVGIFVNHLGMKMSSLEKVMRSITMMVMNINVTDFYKDPVCIIQNLFYLSSTGWYINVKFQRFKDID